MWKTARLFLLEQKGVECNTPMDCFKGLYSAGLIDKRFESIIPKIVRFRNQIVHIYDFSLAEYVYDFIVRTVIEAFEHIIRKLRRACEERE